MELWSACARRDRARIKRWEGWRKSSPPSSPAMFEVRRAGVLDASVSICPPWPMIPSGRLSEPPGPAACGGRSADHWSGRGSAGRDPYIPGDARPDCLAAAGALTIRRPGCRGPSELVPLVRRIRLFLVAGVRPLWHDLIKDLQDKRDPAPGSLGVSAYQILH